MNINGPNVPKESSHKPLTEALLERYWESYITTDERRRRVFSFLYYSLFILLLFVITQKSEWDVLSFKVPIKLILLFAPVFIAFINLTYLYLCARSIDSFDTYLTFFSEVYKNELKDRQLGFPKLAARFKRRDFSENFNIFLYPRKFSPHWITSRSVGKPKSFRHFTWIANFTIYVSNAVPGFFYLGIMLLSAWWIYLEYSYYYILYLFIGTLILCLCVVVTGYFYHSGRKHRDHYRSNFWPETQEASASTDTEDCENRDVHK